MPIQKGGAQTLTLRILAATFCRPVRRDEDTLLRQNNGDPKVVQGLLRHNSIKVTMDIYDESHVGRETDGAQKGASLGHSQTRPYRNAYRVGNWGSCKYLILLASPTGFEPVLPP